MEMAHNNLVIIDDDDLEREAGVQKGTVGIRMQSKKSEEGC